MPNRLLRLPCITEFCRVMQDENGSVRRREAFTSVLKMPGQNGGLMDPPIGEESIRRLGVRPVLASQRNGLAETGCQLPNQPSKSSSESGVTEPAASQFLVESLRRPARSRSAGTLQRLLKQFQPSLFWHPARSFYSSKLSGASAEFVDNSKPVNSGERRLDLSEKDLSAGRDVRRGSDSGCGRGSNDPGIRQ
jgi:hypothetical protein